NPRSGSARSAGGGTAGWRCAGVSSTTVVSIRTAMSAGRADSVAYTAPPIRTAWSASDVAPLPNSFFFSVLRFVSSSLSSIHPPVRIRLRRRPCATRPDWTTRGSHGEFRGANPHAGRTTPGRATRLDGTPPRRVAMKETWGGVTVWGVQVGPVGAGEPPRQVGADVEVERRRVAAGCGRAVADLSLADDFNTAATTAGRGAAHGEGRGRGATRRHRNRARIRAAHGAVGRHARQRERMVPRGPGEGDASVGPDRLAERAVDRDRVAV